jgi:hypothetical protein
MTTNLDKAFTMPVEGFEIGVAGDLGCNVVGDNGGLAFSKHSGLW